MSQERIDEIAYPPTHQYDLETLEPKEFLKKRFDLMPEDFFHGESFLDIGSNKGFFSLYAKQFCKHVEGFDYDKKCVDLCNDLGIQTQHTTFRDYIPERQFDRIILGNVMHYVYKECDGWEFITKLAAISTGQVLIEGPTGMDCKGMIPVFTTRHLTKNFNEKLFFTNMEKYFTLKSKVPSPSHNRWIMLWERKPIPITTLREEFQGYEKIKQSVESTVYKGNNEIVKLQKNKGVQQYIKTFIASESPVSNGVKEWIFAMDPSQDNKGTFVGWTEHICNDNTLRHNIQQDKILPQLIKHQIYLAKMGLHEMDMGISNFFDTGIMFDKGGVWYIKEIQKEAIEDIDKGYFFVMMKNSFCEYPIDYEGLHKVLNTRDTLLIEEFYKNMLVPKKKTSVFEKLFEIKQNMKIRVYRRLSQI